MERWTRSDTRTLATAAAMVLAGGVADQPVLRIDAAARQAGPAELVIVGTVHAATPRFGVGDLLAILRKVKPAVVLFEFPPEMMTPEHGFRTIIPDLLEQQA